MKLADVLGGIVGKKYVLTADKDVRRFCEGYRFGKGRALCVVRPGSLAEFWRVLKACVAADAVVVTQAANTGLTGGSTPHGNDYDRDVVVINTMRIKGIRLVGAEQQAVCLPGATLNELELLLKPLGREPHSVIGSSCIGASVVGGVCNNSGGALVQRGPAYTEMALFARLNDAGELELVNHLGIDLTGDPETVLADLEAGRFGEAQVAAGGIGHDHSYCEHVRRIDEDTPARFNADPVRHYEASGSAGRVAVFAVRVDTFPLERETAVFYIGCHEASVLGGLRRGILADAKVLPVSGEYIHREAFDVAAKYGKDTFWIIKKAGTDYLPKLFALKAKVDNWADKFRVLPKHFSDRLLQWCSQWLPQHLPVRMREFRDRYEHHLILKAGGAGVAEMREYLQQYFADAQKGGFFECSGEEAQAAMLHRLAVASAAVRYRAVNTREVSDIVALDVALRRNDEDWFETLPEHIERKLVAKLYYGHFFCHVFHQDYLVKQGYDWLELEHEMLELLDKRGAKYPAEHNVGHLYAAEPQLADFYRQLDPTNSFNAGIGQTSKKKYWH